MSRQKTSIVGWIRVAPEMALRRTCSMRCGGVLNSDRTRWYFNRPLREKREWRPKSESGTGYNQSVSRHEKTSDKTNPCRSPGKGSDDLKHIDQLRMNDRCRHEYECPKQAYRRDPGQHRPKQRQAPHPSEGRAGIHGADTHQHRNAGGGDGCQPGTGLRGSHHLGRRAEERITARPSDHGCDVDRYAEQ